jgi:hypothetical protein
MEERKNPGRMPGLTAGERKPRPNKVERSGAADEVNEVLLGGGTLKEASGKFRDITGGSISLDSMGRHWLRIRYNYAKLEKLEVLVDHLLSRAAGWPEEDPAEVAREMLLALAAEAADNLSPEAISALPPGELSLLIARLEHAKSQKERVRLGYIQTAMAKQKEIIEAMAEEINTHPGMREEMEAMDREDDEAEERERWKREKA